MGKQGASLVCGGGSSSGQKRKSTGDGNDDDDSNPLWLSLGSIYTSAVAVVESTPTSLVHDSCIPAMPVPRHSADASPAAANLAPPRIPVPAGTAFLATGVSSKSQIASSPSILVDANGGASAVRFASLPVSSPLLLVAPTAISLPAKQATAVPTAPLVPIKQDVQEAPRSPPLPACTAHRSTRRRANGALPPQPPVVGGDPPPPANNGAAGGHGSGSPAATGGGLLASPPFPWATNRVAIHHSISELAQRGITAIKGEVQCRRCDTRKTISYDVASKFGEVREFVSRNIHDMDDRAPAAWTSPAVPDCDSCGQRNSMRPVIPTEKEKINWVFLLLGQTLGLCTLDQLKHFCAHTKQHRTGAKDRVLYSTYMELCNQLSPDKLFKVTAERQKRSQHFYS